MVITTSGNCSWSARRRWCDGRKPRTPLRPTESPSRSSKGYSLSDVSLAIPDTGTAIFRAKLHGPPGSKVWARAWLSNEMDGTLAETESPCLDAGDEVSLTVTLRDPRAPESACIRIESAPLATEQVVIIKLP